MMNGDLIKFVNDEKNVQVNFRKAGDKLMEKNQFTSEENLGLHSPLHSNVENALKNSKKNEIRRKRDKSSKSIHKKRRKYSDSSNGSYVESSNNVTFNKKINIKSQSKEKISDANSDDQWMEKKQNDNKKYFDEFKQDSWMTDALLLKTFTHDRKGNGVKNKESYEKYDPTKNKKELNPYWKSSGVGLPSFQKPPKDSVEDERKQIFETSSKRCDHLQIENKNWYKKNHNKLPSIEAVLPKTDFTKSIDTSDCLAGNSNELATSNLKFSNKDHFPINDSTANITELYQKEDFVTDSHINALAAKILKAEIIGNVEDIVELKKKMEAARKIKKTITDTQLCAAHKINVKSSKNILPAMVNNCGSIKPVSQTKDRRIMYYGRKQNIQAAIPDDKYAVKKRFEGKISFTPTDFKMLLPNIGSKGKNQERDIQHKAINVQHNLISCVHNCRRCLDSKQNDKNLIISIGEKVYLALPWYIGLQNGHCIIIPYQHVSYSTQLDEEVWEEINCFRKSLSEMFATQNKDVIFFEIANKLHRGSHLGIHCIPIDKKKSEIAPFYFKKAIEESEDTWCVNKQLIYLRKKGLQRSIPKGLSYFWVNFGMDFGFAHVIEDEKRFPSNFAQEILGGILELDPSKWRKLERERNIILKVKRFVDCWKKFDFTLNLN
ncbi:CWF19-like protein 2 homolog isoform X2 [Teleopsis dalmanni]|uniref:CWF19-like protein 2 homolog isoform X2 n=1 Tax=Teleopsis dalmanni TaxID=139649 RepID=UPI0018CEA2F1|nr:CWF19-like protein 2 homolog isoform X2 [Teleopsis dalmanni]